MPAPRLFSLFAVFFQGLGVTGGARFDLVSLRDRMFAALHDPVGARWERRYGKELRSRVLAEVQGRVLEVGVGTAP